jgi:DNA end-binding protein Ku
MAGVWSGFLTFGLVTLPVRLYSGARGQRIGFHLLHAKDHVRLKQQMVCPEDGEVVPRDEQIRGYEYAKGEYVVVGDEEIKKAAPHTQKQMEIVQFCRDEEIDPIWFESSYYVLPEVAGKRPYALLERAMEESGFVALARLAMHNREYVAILRPSRLAGVPHADLPAAAEDGGRRKGRHRSDDAVRGLLLHTMFYEDEIRVAEGFARSVEASPSEAELKVAQQLIEALAAPFNPAKFEDTYRKHLEELIAAKLEGRAAPAPEKPRKLAPVTDLMEALKRSLEQTPRKAPQSERVARTAARPPKKPAGSARRAAAQHGGRRRAA